MWFKFLIFTFKLKRSTLLCMNPTNKINAYLPIFILLSFWTAVLVALNLLSDNWSLPFQTVFLYLMVYLFIELSFRPLYSSVRYAKNFMIFLIVLSAIYTPLNFTIVAFSLSYLEKRSFLDILILLTPFLVSAYAVIQYKYWKKSDSLQYRKKIQSTARLLFIIFFLASVTVTALFSSDTTSSIENTSPADTTYSEDIF